MKTHEDHKAMEKVFFKTVKKHSVKPYSGLSHERKTMEIQKNRQTTTKKPSLLCPTIQSTEKKNA